MGYRLVEIDLAKPPPPLRLGRKEEGVGLIARWQDRLIGFQMIPLTPGATLTAAQISALADEHFAGPILSAKVEAELRVYRPELEAALPSLSIAICTRGRAKRLARLLASLDRVCRDFAFPALEIVVVDNAPTDNETRDAAASFGDIRYVVEPKAGLDFARNKALEAARGDLIAFLDDDVVVDRGWLTGLATACRENPGAGGFTGLVLPFRLDSEAQVCFEQHGGFGRGFTRNEFRGSRFDNPLHPVGSGVLGAGCNMAFDRALLLGLGGFDEALDTGPPLPGGGDLDIFYRVLRSGRPMVYQPQYAVYHEHRETLPQLRRQYWSWGLGLMAFLVKSHRSDPALRVKHRAMVRWWFLDQTKRALCALCALRGRELIFRAAELWGGIIGLAGEYGRSCARSDAIRKQSS